MKIISMEEYYLAVAYWLIASMAYKEMSAHEKKLTDMFGENSPIPDSIFDPDKDKKADFDAILSDNGIIVDWNGKLGEKENNDVGG